MAMRRALKEQPHIEGLLQTLSDGVRSLELDLARRVDRGESGDDGGVIEEIKRLGRHPRLPSMRHERWRDGANGAAHGHGHRRLLLLLRLLW